MEEHSQLLLHGFGDILVVAQYWFKVHYKEKIVYTCITNTVE